jgi:hypothetical protein
MYAGSRKDSRVHSYMFFSAREGPYMPTSTPVLVTLVGHTGGLQHICKLGFVLGSFLILWL